jgi:hypothetical protein
MGQILLAEEAVMGKAPSPAPFMGIIRGWAYFCVTEYEKR